MAEQEEERKDSWALISPGGVYGLPPAPPRLLNISSPSRTCSPTLKTTSSVTFSVSILEDPSSRKASLCSP